MTARKDAASEEQWDEDIAGKIASPRGVYERSDPDYIDKIDQRNFQIYGDLDTIGARDVFLQGLPPEERRALRDRLQTVEFVREASAEELTANRPPTTLKIELATLNKQVTEELSRNPQRFYELSPRAFEELIAGILKDMGCDIEITKRTRDGGRDILAAFPSPVGQLLTIVECKRFRPERKIGIDVVERFLYVVEHKDNASCGLIATTSYFSSEAHALARQLPYKLKLRDFQAIREWTANFGNWVREGKSQLWVPASKHQVHDT